jgi:hypothetical protein
VTIILATFVVVFGRAIQQMNVVGGHYLPAAVTPYFIAIGEVAVVLLVVDSGWHAIPFVGTGGAIGAVSAMWVHRKIWRKAT